MMVGVSGTGRSGVKHHYYYCTARRKKLCSKQPVRKEWIEGLVLDHTIALLRDDEILAFIAEQTYQYYLQQNADNSYTQSLHTALDDVNQSMDNLIKAMDAGIYNSSIKQRMDELDEQKCELEAALAAARLKEGLGLTKEHILFFLHSFTNMDYDDQACKKRLIKTFVNSVFVYDDKVVLTFNYSGDDRTITLQEIDAGLPYGVCLPRAVLHQFPNRYHPITGGIFYFYPVFATKNAF